MEVSSERSSAIAAWQRHAFDWVQSIGLGNLAREPVDCPHAVQVGVIGLSGVGKSALINALVAPGQQILPSGGVAPLTGAVARVTAGPHLELEVDYRSRAWVHDTLRRLQRGDAQTALGLLSLLCTGGQYRLRDPEWLEAAMRYALHPDSARPPDEQATTLESLTRLSALLANLGNRRAWVAQDGPERFLDAVREHVCGQAAPLCEAVHIKANTPLLFHGIDLVDLPGLGAVLDSYAEEALRWLSSAAALLLVVDRSGIPASVLAALARSGFLHRASRGEAEIVIAATKLDLVADDARRADRATRPWANYFFSTSRSARAALEVQIGAALEPHLGGRSPSLLRIVPVSADEMHRQHLQDPDARPRLRTAESTGIPELRRALLGMARRCATPWVASLETTLRNETPPHIYDEWVDVTEQEGPF